MIGAILAAYFAAAYTVSMDESIPRRRWRAAAAVAVDAAFD